jgi:hypothetical protein
MALYNDRCHVEKDVVDSQLLGGQMKHESQRDAERAVLERMRQLNAQQIGKVLDFIDSLANEKCGQSSLTQFLSEFKGPTVDLRDVRASLAGITGQLSDVVREQRDERAECLLIRN